MSESLDAFLAGRAEEGVIPGAVWAVSDKEGILAEGAVGNAALVPETEPATLDTIYDVASLTKPMVTSLLFLSMGIEELGLSPEDPVRRFLPEVDRNDKRDILLGHLLTHTSGLPAWRPLYLRGTTPGEYLAQIAEIAPETHPGERVVYSDLGYIMLGEILARCVTASLDQLASGFLFERIGLESTCFNPPEDRWSRVAPTEDSCQYERKLTAEEGTGYAGYPDGIVRGEVHDRNAWGLGGVAGHAGLFSTARDMAMLAREYLGSGCVLLDGEARKWASTDMTTGLEEARSLAFRIALRGETAAGPDLPGEAFGHNGFTGTSIWFDPERERAYILLTNRVHPQAVEGVDMTPLRRRFHSLASCI